MSFFSVAGNTPAGLKSPVATVAALLILSISLPADADEKPTTYEDHVAAILKKNCAACHGDGKQEGGLNLASYSGVMKGAGGGEIVIAGRSGGSRLIEVITAPDDGERNKKVPATKSGQAASRLSPHCEAGRAASRRC